MWRFFAPFRLRCGIMRGMEKMPVDYVNAILPWWWAIIIALVFLFASPIVYAILRDRRAARELTETRKRNFMKWAAWVKHHEQLPVVNANLMLEEGEIVHHAAKSTLVEPRSVRVSNHGGAAYNVGGGLIIGGGRSVSESHNEWRKISKGTVYVTSLRVIFDGDMDNRSVSLSSILSVQADADGAMITTSARQKTIGLTDTNGLILRAAIQIARESY